jgi:PAS domain S-box-containing protein
MFLSAIWGLAYITTQQLQENLQELLSKQQFSNATYIATSISEEVRTRIESLALIADAIDPEWLEKPEKMGEFLEARKAIYKLFKLGLYCIKKDGVSMADRPSLPGRTGASFTEIDYFQEVLRTGKPAIGRPRFGRFSEQPVIVMAVPIRTPTGETVGVLAGATQIAGSEVFNQLAQASADAPGDTVIHVISRRDGMFVTSSDPTRLLTKAPAPGVNAMHDRYMAGFQGSGVAINSRGVEELSSARNVANTDWFVVTALPTTRAYASISMMQWRIFFGAGLVSALVAGLTWLFLHVQITPLGRQAATLSAMTGGTLPLQTLPVEGCLEIRKLTESFNTLVGQIRGQEATLRESEFRFRHLADSVPVLIWMSDLSRECFYFNKPWLAFTGRSQDQEIGMGRVAGVHPEDATACIETYFSAFEARQPFQMEYRLRRHDGVYRWVLDQGTPRYDANGGFLGYIGGCVDITERRLAEEAIDGARKTAEAASQAKTSFLAMMSHEIRTPLTGVIGMADLVLETRISDQQRDYVTTLRDSARSLMAILNDILDFSKIEAGRLDLEEADFDPREMMRNVTELGRALTRDLDIHLSTEIDPATPERISADPVRLRQILVNIVGNAIKFTRKGSVRITLSAGAPAADGGVPLTFEVHDTGIGMSAEVQSRLFQPFSQGHSSIARRFGGTGLGLAISRRLTELMGGTIQVESSLGRGSRFWFTVSARIARMPAIQTPMAAATPCTRPLHILLAEDNPVNQKLIRAMLEKRGHRVAVAENGEQAVRTVGQSRFDLVLMDVQMPVMDGIEATRMIRAFGGVNAAIPIIALTADILAEQQGQYAAVGMNGFIAKPIDWDRLNVEISRFTLADDGIATVATVAHDLPLQPAAGPLIDESRLSLIAEAVGEAEMAAVVAGFCTATRQEARALAADLAAGDRLAAQRRCQIIKEAAGNIGAARLQECYGALQKSSTDEITFKRMIAEAEAMIEITGHELGKRFPAPDTPAGLQVPA